MTTIIVDTSCANISSVKFACERLGFAPIVSKDPNEISDASRVILPGVGAAPRAMNKLMSSGLVQTLRSLSQPLLGICLGMQLLFEELEEGGVVIKGLGLLKGRITELDTKNLPSPHMGWNQLEITKSSPLLNNISTGDYAYFVHSYAAEINDTTLAKSNYGCDFSAVVGDKNVYGCQFHPERSSKTGAIILKNFLGLDV